MSHRLEHKEVKWEGEGEAESQLPLVSCFTDQQAQIGCK